MNGVSKFSTNTIIERDQSQWIFTPAEMSRTPSVLEGMSPAQEMANRQKGVNFITQVGIMLKLPQLTLATASVYLHRFFMRHGMQQQSNKAGLHHYSAAATALFLATKVEENCRKMKELVVACCRVAQKQPNLVIDDQNKEYWKWRDTILQNEDLLLEALCFDLQLEQPYRILFEFLQYYGVQENKILRNTSWAFLNDSHITTMCLLHSPRVVAGAALYAGVKLAGITLPDDESGRAWWDHLELDVMEIQRACNLMFDVYENPALPRVGAKDAYAKEDEIGQFENTRQYLTPRPEMSPSRSVRSVSAGLKRDRAEAEGDQSEEWGAPSQAAPGRLDAGPRSPKRQRMDTPDQASSRQSSRIPPAVNSSRIPPAPQQHRRPSQSAEQIDDLQQRIDSIVASNESSHGHASLTSRPSSQQQSQGPLDRRRSDSASVRQRPPSSNSNDKGRPEFDRRASPQKANGTLTSHDSVDDAEKVDYGSEEGEL